MSVLGFIQKWHRAYAVTRNNIFIYLNEQWIFPYRERKRLLKEAFRMIWVLLLMQIYPFFYMSKIVLLLSPLNRIWYKQYKIIRYFYRYLWEAELRLITGTHWRDITLWDGSFIKGLFGLVTQKSGMKRVSFIHKNFFLGTLRDFSLTLHRAVKYNWWRLSVWRYVRRGHRRVHRRVLFYSFLKQYYVKCKVPLKIGLKDMFYSSYLFRALFFNNELLVCYCVISALLKFFLYYINILVIYLYVVMLQVVKKLDKIIILFNKCHRYLHWKYVLMGDISMKVRELSETTLYDFIHRVGFSEFVRRVIISGILRYLHLLIWFYIFCFRLDFGVWLGCFMVEVKEYWVEYYRLESRLCNIYKLFDDTYNQEVAEAHVLHKLTGYGLKFYNKKEERWEKLSRWDDYSPVYNAKDFKIVEKIFETDLTTFFYKTTPSCLMLLIFLSKLYPFYMREKNRFFTNTIFLNTEATLLARSVIKHFMVTTPIFDDLIHEGCLNSYIETVGDYVEENGILEIVMDDIIEKDLMEDTVTDFQAEEIVEENLDDVIDEFIDDFVREDIHEFRDSVELTRKMKVYVQKHKRLQKIRDMRDSIETRIGPDDTDIKFLKEYFREVQRKQIRRRMKLRRLAKKEEQYRREFEEKIRQIREERRQARINRPWWIKVSKKLLDWFFWWQYW